MPNLIRRLRSPLLLCLFLASGAIAHADPGVTASEILLGTSTNLSGLAHERPAAILDAAKVYFDKINAHGGIHGRKIRLIAYDDAYNPQSAVVNVRKLIDQDQVFALFSVFGAPTIRAARPEIERPESPEPLTQER